ncbi:MAG: sialate O-acetylesterase, partial [Bacteroidota bacterium]
MHFLKISFFFTLMLSLSPLQAQLQLCKLVADHMVLQRGVEVPIWGWAAPGTKISLQFRDKSYSAKAQANRRWEILLPAMTAGGPYSMRISSPSQRIEIKDLLIGDVWLCSGQSNMEWIVEFSANAEEEMANGQDAQIRHFKIPQSSSEQPVDTLVAGEWAVCSPETVGEFTAVGYYFARELRKQVKVPIGLINSSWGGSRIEPWMSAEALGYKDVQRYIAQIQKIRKEEEAALKNRLTKAIGHLPEADEGLVGDKAYWADPALDDREWA